MFNEPLLAGAFVLALSVLLEVPAMFVRMRQVRRALFAGVMVTSSFGGTIVFLAAPSIISFLVASVAVYRVLNSMRVLAERMHLRHAYLVTNRTSRYLIGYQLMSGALLLADNNTRISAMQWLNALSLLALIGALFITFTAERTLARSKLRLSDVYTPDGALPTVSVCIPARNETEDLPGCLASVLASDYPKLEVLVLDDCSHDRTSEIIKGFAQDGVRFIAGSDLKKGWLAKNQAYEALAEAASGELLLFCGVDARFGPKTIRTLVGSMTARKKQMISVLPRAEVDNEHASIVQPMRYWWELALPRRLFSRPPVLSTAWIISKTALQRLGSFRAVDNTVVPEAYFARELVKDDDAYSFMRAGDKLDIRTTKRLEDQWDTAVRLRYPQLRKRPESVLLLAIGELWLLLVPFSVFVGGFFTDIGLSWLASGLVVALMFWVHYRILSAWNVRDMGSALISLPAAVCVELYLLHLSMLRYEFSYVTWKDRNVCIPVMHTIPRLPRV